MKIAVAGTGYVGLSMAILLSQNNKAVAVVKEKIDLINSKKYPIQDEYIEKYLAEKDKDLVVEAFKNMKQDGKYPEKLWE